MTLLLISRARSGEQCALNLDLRVLSGNREPEPCARSIRKYQVHPQVDELVHAESWNGAQAEMISCQALLTHIVVTLEGGNFPATFSLRKQRA